MLTIIFVLFLSVQTKVIGAQRVPCFFIFGDSLVDSGNNNKLKTQARVNYLPYGIDFPKGPTGRFTNGRTMADLIGEKLGFSEFIASFADHENANITQGVNYASGSAGILDESGSHVGEHISLKNQLKNHLVIVEQLLTKFNTIEAVQEHLKKCMYYVGIGNNDYLNNYFVPEHYNSKSKYTPDEYAKFLAGELSKALKMLYIQGARKMVVVGTGTVGCAPYSIMKFAPKGTLCVDEMNLAASLFNYQTKLVVEKLNKELAGASFTFVNITAVSAGPDFKVSYGPCCQPLRSDGQCNKDSKPCPNRNGMLYMDGFHPTEIANKLIVSKAFTTIDQTEVYPVSIDKLVQEQ